MKNKAIIKRVLSFISPYRFYVLLSILCSILSVAASLYIPYVTGIAIDNMLKDGRVFYDGVVKAVIVVHVFGNLADMEAITAIADKYNLVVIEDATEALGSEYKEGI